MKRLASALAALAMGGCATPLMTEEECLAGAWRAAGEEDGATGKWADRFDERANLCAEGGIAVDETAFADYAAGREWSIANLCTYDGGYGFGLAGRSYETVCPPEQEADFLSGYFPGRRIGEARDDLEAARQRYNSAISALDSARASIDRARSILSDPNAKDKAKERARRTLQNADRDIRSRRQDIDLAEIDYDEAERRLDRVERSAYRWARGPEFAALFETRLALSALTRDNPGISFCTDGKDYSTPVCHVLAGGVITSLDGALCAAGPGEARFRRSAPRYEGSELAGMRIAFDFFPYDERGRASRRPEGFLEALFDAQGAYEGVLCGGPQ